jgi:hypothetical protein
VPDPRRFDWLFRPQTRDEDEPLSAEARFAEAFSELPAVERSALALSELGGLDAEEIARRLGTERDIAAALVARARAAVRASLGERSRRIVGALLPVHAPFAVAVAAAGVAVHVPAPAASPPRAEPPRVEARRVAPAAPVRGEAPRVPVASAAASVPVAVPAVRLRARPVPAAPPPPARGASAGQLDRAPGLDLVRVRPVAGGEVRPDDVDGTVLQLPDVAELVGDEVVGRVAAADEDRPHEGVAVIAAQAREAEEPRRVHDAHPLETDGLRVEVESVESGLRAGEPLVRTPAPTGG